MIEKVARANLGVGALTLAIYGIVFFVSPAALGELVGLTFTSADAPVEIRAFYGGLELGIAAFLIVCALNRKLLPAGQLFLAIAFAFAGAARVAGIVQYGSVGNAHAIVAAIELGVAAFSAWLFTKLDGAR